MSVARKEFLTTFSFSIIGCCIHCLMWALNMSLLVFSVSVAFSVDRVRYKIQIPLPPKIDPTVTMMQVCGGDTVADTVCVLECL